MHYMDQQAEKLRRENYALVQENGLLKHELRRFADHALKIAAADERSSKEMDKLAALHKALFDSLPRMEQVFKEAFLIGRGGLDQSADEAWANSLVQERLNVAVQQVGRK